MSDTVLILGSGGREHALAWKLAQSPEVGRVLIAPGNAGTSAVGRNLSIKAVDDPAAVVALCKEQGVHTVVVGPEAPLVAGVVDALQAAGIRAIGPVQRAAQLEGSKAFAKTIMDAAGVPTAKFETHTDLHAALEAVGRFERPPVIKADGLAAGKGVIVPATHDEARAAVRSILGDKAFGAAGAIVVIEEFLAGEEVSIIALCDGQCARLLATSQDHKRIFDGDRGPNTGGMGAYSPATLVDAVMEEKIVARVFDPVLRTMHERGAPYRGILYAGLMIADREPYVLEFNCRLGDPEAQPLLLRLKSDLYPLLLATTQDGVLARAAIDWTPETAVSIVLASKGYPESSSKGDVIAGLPDAAGKPGVAVFHAGTALSDGDVVTAGGRVLGVCALGDGIAQARDRAYAAVNCIRFDGMQYRKDIGEREVRRKATASFAGQQ